MLGRALLADVPAGVEATGLARDDLDVTDESAVRRRLADLAPEVIVNCAGYTSVDQAESEPDAAQAVNALAPGILGRAAARSALVIHFSTDYVFDGSATRPYREGDRTGPLGTYGQSKLAGERELAGTGARHVVVRTSWLFGTHGRSFPRTMWERAQAGQPTRVVDDQWGRPTFASDLARRVWTIADHWKRESRDSAIVHVTNSGDAVTWHGVASRVFARAARQDLLSPCTTDEYPTRAPRPRWSALDTGLADRQFGPLPAWPEALDRFLDVLETSP